MMENISFNEEGSLMKLEFDVLKEDFSRAGEASSKIKKVLMQLGIESKIIRRVAIATYEAEINVAIHSNGGKIFVLVKDKKIEVLIEDVGPGIADIDMAMKEGFTTATQVARDMGFGAGMGLPNMKRCSDEFYIESVVDQYTKVKLVMNL
jgi:anti-sigma regulatory factor (Ser/Thr protein kinase)